MDPFNQNICMQSILREKIKFVLKIKLLDFKAKCHIIIFCLFSIKEKVCQKKKEEYVQNNYGSLQNKWFFWKIYSVPTW